MSYFKQNKTNKFFSRYQMLRIVCEKCPNICFKYALLILDKLVPPHRTIPLSIHSYNQNITG